jgi:hypothetical protein
MFSNTWRPSMSLLVAAIVTLASLGACTTTGMGTGSTATGDTLVGFSWTSDNSTSGSMTATFQATGQAYTGRFFQVTSETRVDDLDPLWEGWGRRGFRGWPYWGGGDGDSFITHYSGRVLANLVSPTGARMRCNFRLVRPSSGMSGGGEGRCQSPDGKTIDATFPAV